jgi:hypothetical protein
MAEIGASCSLPRVPAKVGLPKRELLLRVVGGNASSCPEAVAPVALRALIPPNRVFDPPEKGLASRQQFPIWPAGDASSKLLHQRWEDLATKKLDRRYWIG